MRLAYKINNLIKMLLYNKRERKQLEHIRVELDIQYDEYLKINKKERLMTRNEAIKLWKKHCPDMSTGYEVLIDFLIEAGILKVDKEKTILEEKIDEVFLKTNGICNDRNQDRFLNYLSIAGLKIVEK